VSLYITIELSHPDH